MRQHVHRFRRLAHEVEDAVRLLAERHRIRLQGVDDVRKLDGVADEEDREIVAHEVPVAVFGVEFHGKPAGVAGDFGGIPSADDGGEPDGEWCPLPGLLEDLGAGVFRGRLVAYLSGGVELAIADEAARMHHALGNALAVEMSDLFQELIVFQRRRTAAADGSLRLVVADRMALPVGQDAIIRAGRHAVLAMRPMLLVHDPSLPVFGLFRNRIVKDAVTPHGNMQGIRLVPGRRGKNGGSRSPLPDVR